MVLTPATDNPVPPSTPHSREPFLATVLKWVARLAAAVFIVPLGAFFLEHVGEWYSNPTQALPPWWVHVSMLSHFALIAGLIVLFRWERLGSLIATAGSLAFMLAVAIGQHTLRLPFIILIPLIPVGITIIRLLVLRAAARS